MQDPAADATKKLRDRVAELLDAATADQQRSSALALRINGKLSTKGLLHRARFGPPGTHTAWAEKRAAQLVANCTAHLIH